MGGLLPMLYSILHLMLATSIVFAQNFRVEDQGELFTNNLLTEITPIVVLFGEEVATVVKWGIWVV